jgi:hypothetical protein
MNSITDYLNMLLMVLLDDSALIKLWWETPNAAFDNKCPKDVDENTVKNYLEGYCFGK